MTTGFKGFNVTSSVFVVTVVVVVVGLLFGGMVIGALVYGYGVALINWQVVPYVAELTQLPLQH